MPGTKEDPTKAVNRAVVSTGPITAGSFVVQSTDETLNVSALADGRFVC